MRIIFIALVCCIMALTLQTSNAVDTQKNVEMPRQTSGPNHEGVIRGSAVDAMHGSGGMSKDMTEDPFESRHANGKGNRDEEMIRLRRAAPVDSRGRDGSSKGMSGVDPGKNGQPAGPSDNNSNGMGKAMNIQHVENRDGGNGSDKRVGMVIPASLATTKQ